MPKTKSLNTKSINVFSFAAGGFHSHAIYVYEVGGGGEVRIPREDIPALIEFLSSLDTVTEKV